MMNRMRMIAILMLASSLASSALAKKGEIFTGEVSDSMCGVEHMMQGSKADCARACAGKGSNYALVVGDKIFALETKDKAVIDRLSELAGQKARITGKADGDNIVVNTVTSVK